MDIYTDDRGLVYCAEHRREVCHTCCADHRLTNMAHKHPSADWMELNAKMDALQEVEHRAMLAQWRAEGHTEPLMLGGPHSQRLWDAVAAPPPSGQRTCALPECGVAGDRLQSCSRCRAAYYCCKDHQVRHFPVHKQYCKRRASVAQAAAAMQAAAATAAAEGEGAAGSSAAGSAAGSTASGSGAGPPKQELISWKQLEQLGGQPAQGKVLELRVVSPPSFIRHMFDGKDHRGDIRRVACYADEPPRGLALGRVLRWRNPRYHWFLDGSSGARIEDEDLPHIGVVGGSYAGRP